MKSVGRKDTAPELAVRRYLHRRGLRYRLHVGSLPGTPDIVLPRYRTAIYVHGCFWHGHDCRHGSVQARTNPEYWRSKIAANRERDARKARALAELGWSALVVWECEVANAEVLDALIGRIRRNRVRAPRAPRRPQSG
ncbi:MAG: very short patch repair endonuclease [Burkholderiaceae bacterium]|nr:very short patch repair endonuclease [Burkholderiaceae bacterium]